MPRAYCVLTADADQGAALGPAGGPTSGQNGVRALLSFPWSGRRTTGRLSSRSHLLVRPLVRQADQRAGGPKRRRDGHSAPRWNLDALLDGIRRFRG